MCRFFWNHKDNSSKVVWISWAKMRRIKSQGGLGFRELESFNLAMLAKQGWHLINYPDSLATRLLKEKFYPQSTFLSAPLGIWSSYIWKSITQSRGLLQEGMLKRVGDEKSIKIWENKWVSSPTTFKIQSLIRLLNPTACVSKLIMLTCDGGTPSSFGISFLKQNPTLSAA